MTHESNQPKHNANCAKSPQYQTAISFVCFACEKKSLSIPTVCKWSWRFFFFETTKWLIFLFVMTREFTRNMFSCAVFSTRGWINGLVWNFFGIVVYEQIESVFYGFRFQIDNANVGSLGIDFNCWVLICWDGWCRRFEDCETGQVKSEVCVWIEYFDEWWPELLKNSIVK